MDIVITRIFTFVSIRLLFIPILSLAILSGCGHHSAPMTADQPESRTSSKYESFDGDSFDYLKWLPKQKSVQRVIIGVHGICGIHQDFENFAQFVLNHSDATAVYASNTRSQYGDPVAARRGDIRDPKAWYQDLYRFTQYIRKMHPGCEVVWYGESMGAMIVLNALAQTEPEENKPDKVILSAPVISLDKNLSKFYKACLTLGAHLLPSYRISLNTLAAGQQHEISKDLKHDDEAAMNPYFVKSFTLRFLHTFSKEIEQMHKSIRSTHTPLAIFHGGQDFFSDKESVQTFLQTSPKSRNTRFYHYPEAFHLILYDQEREKIFTDMLDWLNTGK